MNRRKIMINIIAAALVGLSAYFGAHYYSHERGPIYEFRAERDTKPILDIFDKNWHWLIANDDSSPAFMLKYRTPDESSANFGKLIIKVLRNEKDLMGFAAYYMHKPSEGRLLFLAVPHEFRGHGYGQLLAQYAIDDMVKRGAKKIALWTRLENLPAQKIYKELGFKESYYTPSGYVFFEYWV